MRYWPVLPEEEWGENWGNFLRSPRGKMSRKLLNLALMVNENISFVNNLGQISRFYAVFPQPKLMQKENIC